MVTVLFLSENNIVERMYTRHFLVKSMLMEFISGFIEKCMCWHVSFWTQYQIKSKPWRYAVNPCSVYLDVLYYHILISWWIFCLFALNYSREKNDERQKVFAESETIIKMELTSQEPVTLWVLFWGITSCNIELSFGFLNGFTIVPFVRCENSPSHRKRSYTHTPIHL